MAASPPIWVAASLAPPAASNKLGSVLQTWAEVLLTILQARPESVSASLPVWPMMLRASSKESHESVALPSMATVAVQEQVREHRPGALPHKELSTVLQPVARQQHSRVVRACEQKTVVNEGTATAFVVYAPMGCFAAASSAEALPRPLPLQGRAPRPGGRPTGTSAWAGLPPRRRDPRRRTSGGAPRVRGAAGRRRRCPWT